MEEIIIRWSGPYSIKSVGKYDLAYYNGIYAIYRVWGGNVTLQYIGITERGFYQRINEHKRDWLNNVGGQIKVRFGVLEFQTGKSFSRQKLEDAEALLISYHMPKENTSHTRYYCGRAELTVVNVGRRGTIKRRISSIDDFEWA